MRSPDDDLLTTEAYGVVDAAEAPPFSRAVLEDDLRSFAPSPRSTGASEADALAAAPAPWQR